jgi:hypothetical protein
MAGSNLSSGYIAPHHPAAQISKLPKSHAENDGKASAPAGFFTTR